MRTCTADVHQEYKGEERIANFVSPEFTSLKSQRALLRTGHDLNLLGFELDPVTGSDF